MGLSVPYPAGRRHGKGGGQMGLSVLYPASHRHGRGGRWDGASSTPLAVDMAGGAEAFCPPPVLHSRRSRHSRRY